MNRKHTHSVFFSTVNCLRNFRKIKNFLKLNTLLILLAFLTNYPATAQTTDSLTIKPDSLSQQKDSLVVDSLQFGNDLKSKVKYTADDSIVYDIPGEKIFLYGNGVIDYENIHLTANYIEIDNEHKTLFAKGVKDSTDTVRGKPVFKQGNDEFKAEVLTYNFETKKGKISEITTQEGESFVHGETVKKFADNSTFIKHGYYTTCDAEHPHYFIAAKKIKVIPNNKIVTGPAVLVIEDVPTPVMIPFGFFPNKKGRSSGIIFPAYGEETNLGFYLQNGGYYFGISDHFDAALTGDIYSLGSWKANLQSNYAWRYRFNGNFSLRYAETKTSQKELPDYGVNKDFFISWFHSVDPKARPNSTFSASVNAGSSTFYRNTLSSASNYLNNTFLSSISYSKNFPNTPFTFSASLTDNQVVSTRDINLTLPSAAFNVSRITPLARKNASGPARWYEKIGISSTSDFQNLISTKDTLLFKNESLKKFRNGIQHFIPLNTSFTAFKYFTISPGASLTEKWYFRSIEKRFDTDKDTIVVDTIRGFKAAHEYGLNLGLRTTIYGLLQFKKGKIAAIRHVLTPGLQYSWRPDFGQRKYGYYKYVFRDTLGNIDHYSIFENSVYGTPGGGKSSLLNFSLDNNLEMKVRQRTDSTVNIKKIKLLESLSLGGTYNLAADSLKLSTIAITGRTTLFEKVNITGNANYDPYAANSSGTRINKYQWNEHHILARTLGTSLSMDMNIRSKKSDYKSEKGTSQELTEINRDKESYVDFAVPYNLSVHYTINYSNVATTNKTVQTVGFNGDLSLTPKWKITFYSNYDIVVGQWSYTQLGFYRDLHCWEMHFNWTPLGAQANYNFQINVKSSILQDLKLVKKKDPEYFK